MLNFIKYWFNNPRYNPKQFDDMHYARLLYEGKAHGFKFFVVDKNISPCAYIQIPVNHYLYCEDYESMPEKIRNRVHGGITWSDYGCTYYKKGKRVNNLKDWFIGWDYGHLGDRLSFSTTGKKWKTREIVKEAKAMCKFLDENFRCTRIVINKDEATGELARLLKEMEDGLCEQYTTRTTKDDNEKEN